MNVYYSPSSFGLNEVGQVDAYQGGYEWDLFVVWRNKESRYYWGMDSGCSCDSPFSGEGLDSLFEGNAHECIAALQHWGENKANHSSYPLPAKDISGLIEKIALDRMKQEPS